MNRSGKMLYKAEYEQFMAEHGKNYLTKEEKAMRYQIWEGNYLRLLDAIDSGEYTHELAMSSYHDLTTEEFSQYMGLQKIQPKKQRNYRRVSVSAADVDWEANGKVAPVKDQGQCGSCWAFSAIGSVETLYAIQKNLVQFAEQELVDCSGSFGNDGCDGGWMDNGFDYIIQYGIAAESDYVYRAVDQKCMRDQTTERYMPMNGYVDIPENDNKALYDGIQVNSISVAVDAEDTAFYFYKSGIVMKCGTDLDHGVLAVATGVENSTPFWRIKNSWGPRWGEAGHIRLKRDTTKGPGVCGIALAASYPTNN